MTFWQRVGYGFANLARFEGRDDRPTFWSYVIPLYILFTVITSAVIGVVVVQAMIETFSKIAAMPPQTTDNPFGPNAPPNPMLEAMRPYMGLMLVTGLVSCVLHSLFFAAAMVRRLHDSDRTGWWALLPMGAGTIGSLSGIAGFVDSGPFVMLLTTFISFAQFGAFGWMIYLLVEPGTEGPNQFGPPPAS